MKSNKLTDRIKATALAVGLSVLPAKEVDSGVSYGGGVGVDFGGNVSLRGYALTGDKSGIHGRVGLGYNVLGKDRGEFSADLGVSYLFDNGLSLGALGIYNPKSKRPFSVGAGVGHGNVKKDKGNGGEVEEPFRKECIGGTITEEGDCECPEGSIFNHKTRTCDTPL